MRAGGAARDQLRGAALSTPGARRLRRTGGVLACPVVCTAFVGAFDMGLMLAGPFSGDVAATKASSFAT